MTNMPSPQLQRLRSKLKGRVFITMSKGRLIRIALKELKNDIKNIEKMDDYVKGMPALLLSNETPFKLAAVLKKSKSRAPAKAGQIAPNDITVPAGPTSFSPGPIIGELGQIGIKATISEGKVVIKEDTVIVKEGDIISMQVANMLTRLGIEPMEIGINLTAALEEGTLFTKNVLSVDEEDYINNLKTAVQNCFNLAFNIVYVTKDNIKLLLIKAFRDSRALAESRKITFSESSSVKTNTKAEEFTDNSSIPESSDNKKKDKNSINAENVSTDSFKKDEEIAQTVLKKLQDEKLEKAEKEARKPRWAL